MKTKLLTVLLLGAFQLATSQQIIKGTVSDKQGIPLPSASVLIKGTNIGVITDFDGNFSMEASPEDVLLVSYIGYTSLEVPINDQKEFKLILYEGQELEEIVVTALGVTKSKDKITYAAQTISSSSMNQSRISDASQQLSGQVAGLQISTNNGSGVSSSRVILRGESSLNPNKNQPLLVVDGALISNTYVGIGSNPNTSDLPVDYGNSLNDLNPDDFKDVTVLKGPKAAALYGTRATNGALVIRTKSGRYKKGIGISFNSGTSFDLINRFWDEQYSYGGGGQNGDLFNQYRSNWGGNFGPETNGALIAQATPNNLNPDPTPFVQKTDRKGFFELGQMFNNNIALSFSNDDVWGRISLSHLDKTGIIPNTGYEKTNVSFRLGANMTERLSIDSSVNYIRSGSDNVPDIGFNSGGLMYSMLWIMKNFDLDDYRDYWLPNQEYEAQNYFLSWGTNPYLIAYENLNGFTHTRAFGNVRANYTFSENLTGFVRISADRYSDERVSRRAQGQPAFGNGMYREQFISLEEINTDFLLTYESAINDKIDLEVSVGGNLFMQDISNRIARSNNQGIKGVYSLENAADKPLFATSISEKKINSLYGTGQISYDDMLFLDLTARNDWSSTLPTNNNSFFYPSLGLSYIVNRSFDLPESISYLKLRGSIAQTGSDTNPYLINKTYNLGVAPQSITNPDLLPNPELRPERTTALELGMNLKMFGQRLGLEMNYYDNRTKDQILQSPISDASGSSFKLINAGEIRNYGLEVLLSGKPVIAKDFEWHSILNFTRNIPEIISLADGVNTYVIASLGGNVGNVSVEARPGGKMGDIYGIGFKRDPEGNIIYKEVSGQGVRPVTDSQIKKLGNYNHDWTLGITNSFSYKNINLRIFLDYRQGGQFFSRTGSQLYRSGSITETLPYRNSPIVPEGVLDNGNGTYTKNTIATPGYHFYRNYYESANAESNIHDATFLKLRELSIGINLKPYLKKTKFIGDANISIFGRNLFTWTREHFVRHFDPEVLTFNGSSYLPGLEFGQLPGVATYGINLSISL